MVKKIFSKTKQRHKQVHHTQSHIPPLSNYKDTGEEPSSLHNSKHTKHPCNTGTKHNTLQWRHYKGVQLNGSPCANNHCNTRYEQSFWHNKHTHTYQRSCYRPTFQAQSLRSWANYIKGRKTYTTYWNHTSSQRQFKTGVSQGGVRSPTLFNIYTADIPPPRAPVQVMVYEDDINIISTDTSTSAAKAYIPPYLHTVFAWPKQSHTKSRQNNLHSVHSGPCRI